jgi:TolB-like protein
MQLFEELKRRNVFRVGAAYAVVAWLVLQIGDLVLENISAPPWVMQVLLLVVAVGLPLALLLAWAFELTPGGLKLDAEVDRSKSIATQTGKRLDRVIIGVLLVIVAVMAVERIWFANDDAAQETVVAAEPVTDKSIAVLPFVDLSEAQDQGWFAKGLADEMLNALMRTPDLLVASRTSAFSYIDSDLDIREIASELGVAHVVEGSIRRSGDSIRVTAQLIRASDGFHVWSQNYDREVSDVIAIQEDLAVSIARALETSMDPAALQAMMAAGTRSVQAYEHYLNGLAHLFEYYDQSDFDVLNAAYESFEKARQSDPTFAKAHAEAARFWRDQLQVTSRLSRATSFPMSENLQRYESRIQAAIDTAPDQVVRWQFESELANIRLEFRKEILLLNNVLDARPNFGDGWAALLESSIVMGEFEAADEATQRLIALYEDGRNPMYALNIILGMQRIGKLDESAAFARQALQDRPGNIGLTYQAHRALLWAGEVAEAARLMPTLANDTPASYVISRVRQACAEGRRADAEKLSSDFVDSRTVIEADTAAWHLYMLLGQVDSANEVIRQATSTEVLYPRASWLFYGQFDPTPFPELMAVLERENVIRRPTVEIPFACKQGE